MDRFSYLDLGNEFRPRADGGYSMFQQANGMPALHLSYYTSTIIEAPITAIAAPTTVFAPGYSRSLTA